jgi:hypothetical protein
MRRLCCIALAVGLSACGGKGSPAAPSTPTPTTPTTFTLSGHVTSTAGAAIASATVRIVDSANAGRSTTTDSGGSYSLTGLQVAGFTVNATATNYQPLGHSVVLTSNQTVDFVLTPTPPFTRSGIGDTVFDMPTTVSRIAITGSYSGFSTNFIVRIAGSHVVNELLGTAWGPTTFSGTYVTHGGVVEILSSSGVAWSFTEVR